MRTEVEVQDALDKIQTSVDNGGPYYTLDAMREILEWVLEEGSELEDIV